MVEQFAWSGRITLSLAIVVLWFLSGAVARAAKPEPLPDWVRSAAAETVPKYPAETKAVVLLDDTTYAVAPDGKATEHRRRVVKILRPAGRGEGVVEVPFDKDTRILSLHVWSIGPDGHEYAVNDKEMVDEGYPGQGNYYEDEKVKAVKAPGRDPGGVIAYEYEQQERPYSTEKTWSFQSDIPQVSQTFTLQLPPGYIYRTEWAHHSSVPVIDLEHQHWRWEMKDTPGINLDRVPMRPSELALAGRMTVHYGAAGQTDASLGTWQSIGEWYRELAKDRLTATPEIAAKANELTVGKTDFYDKTEAVAVFVQKDIRYFVIEMGIGGIQPHFAGDIFHNRYGDCKDKAVLVSALLSSVGIHSALMMVDHRRGVIDPNAPSMVGDHMIAAIEIPKGYESPRLRSVVTTKTGRRYLIFDPTWDKTAFGQLEHGLQGGYGLLLEGSDSQIIELPVLAPELNTIRRSAKFELHPDGSLSGSVTEKRFGDVSEDPRVMYTMGDAKEQQTYLDHVLERDFTNFHVSDMKVENAAELNKDLTTTYTITSDKFGKSMGPLLMLRPRVMGGEFLETDHERRMVPINLRETMQIKDDYDIELPAGYAVDEIPDPVKLDLGFAAYESSSVVKGNTLHYARTYTVRAVTLAADKYGELQKLAGTIAADEQNQAVLKKQ